MPDDLPASPPAPDLRAVVRRWVDARWHGVPTCPVCRGEVWDVAPTLTYVGTAPAALLTCRACALTLAFNGAGLILLTTG